MAHAGEEFALQSSGTFHFTIADFKFVIRCFQSFREFLAFLFGVLPLGDVNRDDKVGGAPGKHERIRRDFNKNYAAILLSVPPNPILSLLRV